MTPRVSPWRRADGLYYARVYWPGQPTPSRYSLGTRNADDVDGLLKLFIEHRLPLLTGKIPAKKKRSATTIADLVYWYLDIHLPYLGREKKTIVNYATPLRSFAQYCRYRHVGIVEQISTRIVQEWQLHIAQGRPANKSAARRDDLLAVRRWLAACEESGQIAELPRIAWNVSAKGKGSRFRAISREELAKFLQTLRKERPALYPITAWVAASGWRISDALDLRVGEIRVDHIDRDQIKTSKGMLYPLTPALRDILKLVKFDPKAGALDHVFRAPSGAPWAYHELKKQIDYWAAKHKYRITFRDLRKTFASRLAMDGCPPNVLKELLGHEDVTMTLAYYVDVDMPTMAVWATRYGTDIAKTTDTPA